MAVKWGCSIEAMSKGGLRREPMVFEMVSSPMLVKLAMLNYDN
ncbi:MAG: hypothetical protein ACYT04_36195 [Nostoc sp.]